MKEPPDAETAQRQVTAILKNKHALLILDNAVDWKSLKYMLPTETCSSILITTRNREMYDHIRLQFHNKKEHVYQIELEKFSKLEALELFREMLERKYRSVEEDIYLKIATNLGFLPIALRQAISLMVFGPGYRAARLLKKLKNEDRLALLRKGRAEADSDELTIESVFDLSTPLLTPELIETMQYMAVCSPGPVPLDFIRQLAKYEEIEEQLERLHKISWCERRERDGELSYELHQLVRELVHRRYKNRFKEDFFQLVHDIFLDEDVHFSVKDRFMPQLEEAFTLGKADRDERLKKWLYGLFDFCTNRGFGDFYVRLTQCLEDLFPEDKSTLGTVYRNRTRIYWRQGKLENAMNFHQMSGVIYEELDDRAQLARSYANQAVIHKEWGQLDQALNMFVIVEEIFEKLNDRDGLAQSYANQALILRDWGKLDDAMALHKKEERICNELSDRAQLARSYGNQALILSFWGKLDDAMALHKKEEKIFEELGNLAGLAVSWWNQGDIYNKKGYYKKQEELWRKSIEMKKSIGIPTEEDEKELEELENLQ